MKTPKKLNGITEPMSQRDFENGPLLRDVVAETSRGMAHNRLESISIVTLVVMLDCCSHCWLLKTTAIGLPQSSGRATRCHGPKDVQTCAATPAADAGRCCCEACRCAPKGATDDAAVRFGDGRFCLKLCASGKWAMDDRYR